MGAATPVRLRESDLGLELPPAGNADAVDEAMRLWELSHRDRLTESEVEDTHFFGFAGQSLLAKLIDFVFISADLRAYEETDDRRNTAIGRILDHAVDRSEATEQLGEIEENAHQARQDVHTKVYGPVLDDLSAALSDEVAKFTTGRQVVVTPVVQAPKLSRTSFEVSGRPLPDPCGPGQRGVHQAVRGDPVFQHAGRRLLRPCRDAGRGVH